MATIKLTANETRFVQAMEKAEGAAGKLRAELNVNLVRAFRETDFIARQFSQGIDRAAKEAAEAAKKIAKASEEAAQKVKQLKMEQIQALSDMGNKLQAFGTNMSAFVTAPILAMGAAALKTYGEIDQLKRALDTYGVSLNEIKKTAKLPGLGIEEAAQATIKFLSVKYSADLSNKAVREFGNALVYSGRGKEDLAGIANAFAQMKGKPGVMAQEINQLAERLPMIRDLMQQAFGTSDAEVIRDRGIKADEFLDKITQQLEKLPRVAGGFKVAMENIWDSIKIGAYELGTAGDKLFDFTGLAVKVSAIIDGIVQSFKDLEPEVQKAIFVITGITAAIGPMIVAVGLAVKAYSALLAGVGMVTLAITAVVVAVAAAVAIGLDYYQTKTKLASANKSLAELEEDSRKSIHGQAIEVQKHMEVLRANNSTLDQRKAAIKSLNEISPEYFGNLKAEKVDYGELITSTSKYITNLENISKAKIIQADIEKKLQALHDLRNVKQETAWLDDFLMAASWKVTGSDPVDLLKYSNLIKLNTEVAAGNIEQGIKPLQAKLAELIKTLGFDPTKELKKEGGGGGGGGGGNAFKGVLKSLDIDIQKFHGDLQLKVKEYGTRVLYTSEVLKNLLNAGFGNAWLNGLQVSGLSSTRFSAQLNVELNKFGVDLEKATQNMKQRVWNLQERMSYLPAFISIGSNGLKILPTNFEEKIDEELAKFQKAYQEKIGLLLTGDELKRVAELSKVITQQVEGFIEGSLEAIGTGIGTGNLQKTFSGIMSMVGDFMIQLGKELVKINTLIEQAVAAIGTGPLAIALGVGLIVAGGIIKGSQMKDTRKFANGGIVYGPTMGLMGEYPGASSNPEVIAPLSKLKDMIGGAGGGQLSIGDVRLEGEALVFSINRYLRNNGKGTIG